MPPRAGGPTTAMGTMGAPALGPPALTGAAMGSTTCCCTANVATGNVPPPGWTGSAIRDMLYGAAATVAGGPPSIVSWATREEAGNVVSLTNSYLLVS